MLVSPWPHMNVELRIFLSPHIQTKSIVPMKAQKVNKNNFFTIKVKFQPRLEIKVHWSLYLPSCQKFDSQQCAGVLELHLVNCHHTLWLVLLDWQGNSDNSSRTDIIRWYFRRSRWRRWRSSRISRALRISRKGRIDFKLGFDDPWEAVYARFGPTCRIFWYPSCCLDPKSIIWPCWYYLWPLFGSILDIFWSYFNWKSRY